MVLVKLYMGISRGNVILWLLEFYEIMEINNIFFPPSQWSNGTVDKLHKTTAKYLEPTRKKSFEQIKLFPLKAGKEERDRGFVIVISIFKYIRNAQILC